MESDGPDQAVRANVEVAFDVRVDPERLQMYREFATLYEDLFHTFCRKNQQYGNTFVKSGQIESGREGGPFSDPVQASLYQVYTRTGDKRGRFYNLVFGNGGDGFNESAFDTALDAANYWIQMAYLIKHGGDEDE